MLCYVEVKGKDFISFMTDVIILYIVFSYHLSFKTLMEKALDYEWTQQ